MKLKPAIHYRSRGGFSHIVKQFHLSATLVKGTDGQRRKRGLVGQKYQGLAGVHRSLRESGPRERA
jgi:hypothetical protein